MITLRKPWLSLLFLVVPATAVASATAAFVHCEHHLRHGRSCCSFVRDNKLTVSSWRLFAKTDELERILQERYPTLDQLLKDNTDVWKNLNRPETVDFTVFAPSEQAFADLGETKLSQLQDVRNSETALKVGAYHVIGEKVAADALFDSAGVVTMGGQVPVDRSVTGGMFGIGGKEDGGSVVGGAKVLQSYSVGDDDGIIHEVDGLISPNILWRYMDQLRIPLSR